MLDWTLNPFWLGDANWGTGGLFLDRGRLIDKLDGYAANPGYSAAVLAGPRRMGKTAIVKRLQARWSALEDAPSAYLDARDYLDPLSDRLESPAALCAAIEDRLVAEGRLNRTPSPVQDFASLAARWRVRQRAGAAPRLLLIIDEVEHLHLRSPELVVELLRCFRQGDDRSVFLLLSWGIWLGTPLSAAVAGAVKDVPFEYVVPVDRGPFQRDMRGKFEEVGLSLGEGAADILWGASQGHPYYAMAVAHELYESRVATKDRAVIEPSEVSRALVERAARRIDGGLQHSWDQVAPSQLALCWGLSQLALRTLPSRGALDVEGCRTGFPTAAVKELLEHQPTRLGRETIDGLRSATAGLEQNYVIERADDPSGEQRWRIRSPLFELWLGGRELKHLNPDTRRTEDGSNKSADDLLAEAREAIERSDDGVAGPLLRRALDVAPLHPDTLTELARLKRRAGLLSEAAALFREARVRGSADAINAELAEVVERQILAAIEAQDDPFPLWEEHVVLSRSVRHPLGEATQRGIVDAFAARWRERVEDGRFRDALAAVRGLERDSSGPPPLLTRWRRRFLEHYAAFMRSYPRSPEQLGRCLGAIACGLLPLTDEADEGTGALSLTPTDSLAKLPMQLRAFLSALAPGARVVSDLSSEHREALTAAMRGAEFADAWEITLEALEAAGTSQAPLVTPANLDAVSLRLLMLRAPADVFDRLRGLLRRHLVRFCIAAVRDGSHRVASLLDLLREIGGDPLLVRLDPVVAAIQERVFELGAASPSDLVEQAFETLPRLMGALLAWPADGVGAALPPRDIVDLAEIVVDAARGGSDRDSKESWRVVAKFPSAAREWRELLGRVLGSNEDEALDPALAARVRKLVADLTLPEDLVGMARLPGYSPGERSATDEEIVAAARRRLDPAQYQVDRFIDTTRTPGWHHLVQRFEGAWKGRHQGGGFVSAHIKLYQLPGDDRATRQFLETLWAQERRVLFEIGSRNEGRALARMYSSELRAEDSILVLVTEPVGRVTLRDLLDTGRARRWCRDHGSTLWREIAALMRGIQALHDAHCMHRNLRAETIHVRFDDSSDDGTFRFKLVDFEWSIYLHAALADRGASRRHRDHYLAPEVLLAELTGPTDDGDVHGESFASDLYSIGVLLFELLVRPLTSLELGEFRDRRSYSVQRHREFVENLRAEVRDPRSGLPEEVQLMLLGLLRFEASSRSTTLRTAIAQARVLALGAEDLQRSLIERPVPVVATLQPGGEDAIASYIHRHPGLNEKLETVDDSRTFIEKELLGARVFENATSAKRPLYLEGRRVNFTATPFVPADDADPVQGLAYLWVATPLDMPTDEPLAELTAGVAAHNLRPPAERHTHIKDEDDRWRTLFALSGAREAAESRADVDERTLLHEALELTAQAERELLEEQIVSYQLVSGPDRAADGRSETIVIGPRASTESERQDPDGPWRGALRRTIAQQSQLDDPFFELAERPNVSDWIQDDMVWQAQDVDADDEQITLTRRVTAELPSPPSEGWVRGEGIRGSQALLSRRAGLLRRLRDDRHVLQSVNRPVDTHHGVEGPEPEFFHDGLDTDKKRIARRVRDERPLLLVKGPPGTGKTTLAAEVVLQELAQSASARILVTSQGHDPLNHLLQTVADALEAHLPTKKREGRLKEPLMVRLVPERRLLASEDIDSPGREIETRFDPARVAGDLLQRTRSWTPDRETPVESGLLEAWRSFVDGERRWNVSEELRQRVIDSANIVCVTANDRALENPFHFKRPFDLLIYEEAGRALPLELLGPMTNAPRWMLIGDPDQLPPHQALDMSRVLSRGLGDAAAGGYGAPSEDRSRRRHRAIQLVEMFRHLWTADRDGSYSDRLTYQFRMHPAISRCVGRTYYGGELQDYNEEELRERRRHRIEEPLDFRGRSIVWVDVPWVGVDGTQAYFGEERASGGGYVNHAEVHVIQKLLAGPRFKTRGIGGFRKGEVVFLSPYRAQVERFRRVFRTWRNPQTGPLQDIAHTVDSFQGRQADVVFVSLVRNNRRPHPRGALGFLTSPARSVVMFSRAQSLLVVVGCVDQFRAFRDQSPVGRFFEEFQKLIQSGDAAMIRATDEFDAKSHNHMRTYWNRREHRRQSGPRGTEGPK